MTEAPSQFTKFYFVKEKKLLIFPKILRSSPPPPPPNKKLHGVSLFMKNYWWTEPSGCVFQIRFHVKPWGIKVHMPTKNLSLKRYFNTILLSFQTVATFQMTMGLFTWTWNNCFTLRNSVISGLTLPQTTVCHYSYEFFVTLGAIWRSGLPVVQHQVTALPR